MDFCSHENWTILSSVEQSIKKKIEQRGKRLREWDHNIYRGILTGFNDAFIISGEKKDELIAKDPKSAEIIRPILRGRDIKRYGYSYADLWLISTFPSRKYDIDSYPSVKKHLLSFGMERLEQTGKKHIVDGKEVKARKKTNNAWFETQDSINYWDDFSKQKIVWGNLCLNAQYAMAEPDMFINAPSPMIVPGEWYMLAILNSKLADWYIRGLGVTRNGGYFEYKPMFVDKLPIPKLNLEQQELLGHLAKSVQDGRAAGISTAETERNIDSIVYTIYGLTEAEIAFIEEEG